MPSQIATRLVDRIIGYAFSVERIDNNELAKIIDADLAPVREALEWLVGEVVNHPDGHMMQFQRAERKGREVLDALKVDQHA